MINALLILSAVYLSVGLLFAVVFAVCGAKSIDANAHGSSMGFRFIIIPGSAALWPWLAWRWASRRVVVERTDHRIAAETRGGEAAS